VSPCEKKCLAYRAWLLSSELIELHAKLDEIFYTEFCELDEKQSCTMALAEDDLPF